MNLAMPILPQVGTLRHSPIGRAGTARYLCIESLAWQDPRSSINCNWVIEFSMGFNGYDRTFNLLEPTRQESQSVFGALSPTGSGRNSIKDFSHLFFKFPSSSNIFQHHSWGPMNMSPLGVCEGTEKNATLRDPLLDHLDSKRWGATAVARSPTSSALSVPSQDSSGWQSGNLTDLIILI